ncbi:winged helix DNA-binding domain-containing protein [Actinomadura sp. ATCC 31491]|uniref:Winged helix DNA-binding domain-containing protein n=1 Tax=Actinomadura luzonensis TaxID=2805427 RepID=A0ABT0G132_9ACTN|nr:crosslink repair DNA glycosylase YcaQ family protein [Actinomadura luzonensis]MCK2217828.1 winged helix DNA-binding domain-containing protein [Actinomadura luzonensis]
MAGVLDGRALNRATLARQLLLDRADLPVLDAVAHLCGLQAQEPQEPFVGLWSRLRAFDPAALSALLTGRRVVRTHVAAAGAGHLPSRAGRAGPGRAGGARAGRDGGRRGALDERAGARGGRSVAVRGARRSRRGGSGGRGRACGTC